MGHFKSYQLALVTGATSGIGEALCFLLAEKGVNLLITGRNQTALDALQEALKHKVKVHTVVADLSKREDRQILIKQIHLHGPDLVVNNAGYGLYGDALTYETAVQSELFEVNGMAVLELTLEAARTMVSKNLRGTILNVSSSAAFQLAPVFTVYGASKAFVNYFSESFDYEMKPYGIRVLAICPGMVATEFSERARIKAGSKEQSLYGNINLMSAQFVAERIWWQIQNLKPLYVINWKYRLLTFLTRYIVPKSWSAKVMQKFIKDRIKPRPIIPNVTQKLDLGLRESSRG